MERAKFSRTAAETESETDGFDNDSMWLKKPEMIKCFIDQRPDYENLCAEVAYILKRELIKADIKVSSITSRAKTLNSFLEKIQRKSYLDPIREVTDFAGVRVVCLYVDDLIKVQQAIAEHFEILEKIDKLTDKKPDQFGYGAIHFIVKLGKTSSGARYDDLKNLVCEIQTRTVLQDAWAIIDHHLVYKNESNIPSVLRTKLNLLAGTFESADEEFKSIRDERQKYLTGIEQSKISTEQFLDNELNLDSFVRYAQWKFPKLPSGTQVIDVPFFLHPLIEIKLTKLVELDSIVEQGKMFYDLYLAENGRDFLNSYAITSVVAALLFVNKDYTPAEHIRTLFPKYIEFIDRQNSKN
jgi:putative GTP pyrophosphokinase